MGKVSYKISSRATILLGRESVSKADGAIIELVKNTYDADASICLICFDDANDCIYIIDNGTGMNEDILFNHWMMIGTDNKKEGYISKKKRIKSGEKGIGRFALDRLGSYCEMFTKHEGEELIRWAINWNIFEESGKTLQDVEAEYDNLGDNYLNCMPNNILSKLEDTIKINGLNENESLTEIFETGTCFKISGLRDTWDSKQISKIEESLGYLIPPIEQNDYCLYLMKGVNQEVLSVTNEVTEEYDYRIKADFDGEKFTINIIRNEFDLNKIPDEVFVLERFQSEPFRREDFDEGIIIETLTPRELMMTKDEKIIKTVKEIGPFSFKYLFMKMSLQEDSKETFYYKEISNKRKLWLDEHSGIKIYRDNFLVRPYGDKHADSFDWLGLDARRARNPAAVSHPSGRWHVRNRQGQGTVLISRVNNNSILDKSSREGIIENEHFAMFKKVLVNIIARFEKDRAHIGHTMKIYADKKGEKEQAKESGRNLAQKILNSDGKKKKRKTNKNKTENENKTLAKAVKYYEEEREELISEIKLLRSLATNGLITSSVVHDLKSINAMLVNRVDSFEDVLRRNNTELINRSINDLRKNDIFLKAWISTITNQVKSDKRKRLKKDLYLTVKDIIGVMEPILSQKKVEVNFSSDDNIVYKRIFISDFESIIYNLIINSVESFEKSVVDPRVIKIVLESGEDFIIHYSDNGKGLEDKFSNPYEIFDFGTTSKYDLNGEQIGTGLGMYIVASTVREYNASFKIVQTQGGFALDLIFPK